MDSGTQEVNPEGGMELLEHFKSLSPNHVYFLAPKVSVLRGFEYYAQSRVESYAWDRALTTLSVSVRGSRRYLVTVNMNQGEPRYSCSCPAWTFNAHCKHVICTLLTTVNLLVPDSFRMPNGDPTRQRSLTDQLIPDRFDRSTHHVLGRSSVPFEVVLDDQGGAQTILIMRDGKVCRSFAGMPTELAVLLRSTQDPAWSIEDGLRDFLNHHGQAYTLFYQGAKGKVSVKWNPTAAYTTKTELHAVGSQVIVSARCLRFGVVQTETHVVFGFVVDVKNQTLGPLEHERGWAVYDELWEQSHKRGLGDLRERIHEPLTVMERKSTSTRVTWRASEGHPLKYRGQFKVTIEDFPRLQCDFTPETHQRDLDCVIFRNEGKEVSLVDLTEESSAPKWVYRMTLIPEGSSGSRMRGSSGGSILRAECRMGDVVSQPRGAVFDIFSFLNQENFCAKVLKTKKRQSVFYETFFRLCRASTPSEAKKILRVALAQEEFRPFRVKAEVEHVLKRFSTPALEETRRVLFYENTWCLIPNARMKETCMYEIAFGIWGPQVFNSMPTSCEMVLPTPMLYGKLPELHQSLKEAGIALFFADKPVLTSKWEYAVDARRPSAIDWFELHPEITCDGKIIDTQDISALLKQGGLMERDGVIRIIDKETQETLRALATLTKGLGKKRQTVAKRFIVQVPKLQILDWVALRKRGVRVMLSNADEELIDRLLNFQRIDPVPVPRNLKAKLRKYQQEGYQWLAFLYRHRLGACLADDMGLGKTLQAICLFASIQEGLIKPPEVIHGPHLVVLPPSLLFNWEHEFSKFYPNLRIMAYTGKERSLTFSGVDVVLTTYGLVRRDIAALEQIQFHAIVFDEAQAVKNILARTTGAARRLNGYFKCVMTGTPLENHVGEYYSLMDLCVPGLLGDYEDLKGKLKNPPPEVLDMVMHRTTPFVLRRTKSQILKELPPKMETDIYLELTDRQKVLYQETVTQIRSNITRAYQQKTSAQARIIALTAILKLRQLCLSPRLLSPKSTDGSPKLNFLIERLRELIDEGHSALVFSQFTSFLDVVEPEFHAHAIPYVRLDGATPTPTRKKLVHQFQESEHPSIFLLSLKAGGQGLNLTKASYVFHLDPWWNPAVENQASDRAHRIGQQRKVSIMRLLMRHTIEEKMMKLKEQKLELYHAVLEGATHRGGTGLTQEDFEFLLG